MTKTQQAKVLLTLKEALKPFLTLSSKELSGLRTECRKEEDAIEGASAEQMVAYLLVDLFGTLSNAVKDNENHKRHFPDSPPVWNDLWDGLEELGPVCPPKEVKRRQEAGKKLKAELMRKKH